MDLKKIFGPLLTILGIAGMIYGAFLFASQLLLSRFRNIQVTILEQTGIIFMSAQQKEDRSGNSAPNVLVIIACIMPAAGEIPGADVCVTRSRTCGGVAHVTCRAIRPASGISGRLWGIAALIIKGL